MKRYDDMGLPMDGYNYYQHIVDPNAGIAPTFAFTMTYDHVVRVMHGIVYVLMCLQLPEDNDFKKEKMNAEGMGQFLYVING